MEWNGSILIASIVALLGIVVTMRNHKVDFLNEQISRRKDKITQQIVEFYVPIMTYLQISKALSRKLYAGKPKDFDLLSCLLGKDYLDEKNNKIQLTEKELKLLDSILELSDKIEDIINKKAGLVEDKQLTMEYMPSKDITNITLDIDNKNLGLLGLLLVHYKVIKSARTGIIQGDFKYYDQFKFPREIVSVIENNYKKLKNELEKTENIYIKLLDFIKSMCK